VGEEAHAADDGNQNRIMTTEEMARAVLLRLTTLPRCKYGPMSQAVIWRGRGSATNYLTRRRYLAVAGCGSITNQSSTGNANRVDESTDRIQWSTNRVAILSDHRDWAGVRDRLRLVEFDYTRFNGGQPA